MLQAPRPNADRAEKTRENQLFLLKKKLPSFFFYIFLLVMPKYWGKQIFTHERFPEVGEKQKAQKKEKEKKKKKVGENNGQLRRPT